MLKSLMKAAGIGGDAKPEATVETPAAEVIAEVSELDTLRAEFESYKETAEGMVAAAEEQAAALTAQLAEAQAALAAATEALQTAAAEKLAAVADAEAQRLAARKEKVVAAIGTERADGLLKATEGMDDAAFEAVVSALGVSAAAEAAAPLFKEVGVTAEANAAQVVETAEMRILKAKYAKK